MAVFKSFLLVCLFLSVRGKPVEDLSFNNDEINHRVENNSNDIWKTQDTEKVDIQIESISEELLRQICRNKDLKIYVRDKEVVLDCSDLFEDDVQEVFLVKRDVKNEEVEGSGDETPLEVTTITTQKEDNITIVETTKTENSSPVSVEIPNEEQINTTEKAITNTEDTLSPKNVSDELLLGASAETTELAKQTVEIINETEAMSAVPNNEENGKSAAIKETNLEEVKTGESTEKAAVKPNTVVLLIFVGLGCLAAATLTFNYLKTKREDEEDARKCPELEGREMKPLMKNGQEASKAEPNTQEEPTPFIDE